MAKEKDRIKDSWMRQKDEEVKQNYDMKMTAIINGQINNKDKKRNK